MISGYRQGAGYAPEMLLRLADIAATRMKVPERWHDDAVGEFVLAALLAARREPDAPRAYPYRCGRGAIQHFLRRERRMERLGPGRVGGKRVSLDLTVPGMDDDETALAETVVDPEAEAPDAALLRRERSEAVEAAVRRLPAADIDAVALVWLGETPQGEAALALNLSRRELQRRLWRIQVRLRVVLSDYGQA